MKICHQLPLKICQVGNLRTSHLTETNKFKKYWEDLYLQARPSGFMDLFLQGKVLNKYSL